MVGAILCSRLQPQPHCGRGTIQKLAMDHRTCISSLRKRGLDTHRSARGLDPRESQGGLDASGTVCVWGAEGSGSEDHNKLSNDF